MAQHNTTHILATVRMAAKASSVWVGETALWGLRIGTWPLASDPGRNGGEVPLHEYLTNDAAVTRTPSGWSVEQGWAGDSGGGINITDADQDSVANALLAFLTTTPNFWPTSYELESIRLYNIGRNGLTGSAPSIYTPTASVSGTTAAMMEPTEALVVSLGSAQRGRTGRGRFYLGPLGSNWRDNTGIVNAGMITTLGANAVTLIAALEGVGGVEVQSRVLIVHRASQNGIEGSPSGAIVNGLRVGNQFDRQSRRRRQVPEVYQAFALP